MSGVGRNHGYLGNGSQPSSPIGSPRVVEAVRVLTQEIFGKKDAFTQTEPTALGDMPQLIIHDTPVTPTVTTGSMILTRMRRHLLAQENGYDSDGTTVTNSSIAPPGAPSSKKSKKQAYERRPSGGERVEPTLKRERRSVVAYVPSSRVTVSSSSSSSSSSARLENTQRKINEKAVSLLIPIQTRVRYDRMPKQVYEIISAITSAGDVSIRRVHQGSRGPIQSPVISAHVSQLKPLTKTGIVLLQDLTTANGKYHGLVKVTSVGKNGLLEGNWFGFGGTALNEVSIKGRDLLGLIPMNAESLEDAQEMLEGLPSISVPWKPYEGAEDVHGTFYELYTE